ncbi:MAG: hypothetical protein WAM85_15780 [Terracidiphilus sp.]
MARKKASQLAEALNDKTIVRFSSPYEPGWTDCYVLDIGSEFFLLSVIDDNQKFNGFQCSRISDVRRMRVPAPYADFVLAALLKLGQRINSKPDIDLSSLPALLKSANALFPLVTIHRGRMKPDECVVGKVLDISESNLLLRTIDPGAVWDEKPSKFRLSDITRVDFGGGYEEALHLVGGKPKPLKNSKRLGKL